VLDELDCVGTVWNARVTSAADIREGVAAGGGVPVPSSDLTSCKVKGTEVISSAMFFREFAATTFEPAGTCDHTALRKSGSGSLAEVSLTGDVVVVAFLLPVSTVAEVIGAAYDTIS
jgi:hypothetical protein